MHPDPRNGSPVLDGLDLFVGCPLPATGPTTEPTPRPREVCALATDVLRDYGATVFSAHVVGPSGGRSAHCSPERAGALGLRWMSKCDAFVPVLPASGEAEPAGTGYPNLELGWATALGRPVVIITRRPVVEAGHVLQVLHRIGDVQVLDPDRFARAPFLLVECVLRATSRQREALRAGRAPFPS